MPLKVSLYKLAETRDQLILHKGYSYEGNIFRKTMSDLIFRDETRAGILATMEAVVFNLIEKVKQIKNHVNFIVPKDYKDKN